MHLSIDEFWKLVAASELLTPAECATLNAEFSGLQGDAGASDVKSLSQWLLSRGKLTAYQAAILAAGRPGPFVFGPFVVMERIEHGRLARLFRATFEGKQPVLLVLMAQLTDDTQEYQPLADLAKVAAAVKNPHVTRTHLATRQRSQSFIVTESLAGQSLAELLAKGRLAPQIACQIGFQVALGLIALHAEKLTHGGVSPRNIWIGPSGGARLMQFPLSPPPRRQPRGELPLADYVAPEWFAAEAEPTPAVDIYGLGCVLFELLSGRVPFPGGTVDEKRTRHRREMPERLDAIDAQTPEELAELVDDMLAKDPILRCESASHVAHLLAPFATNTRGRAVPPKIDPQTLTPGYGAWHAPEWQAPPQELLPQKPATQADPPRTEPAAASKPSAPARAAAEQAPSPTKAAATGRKPQAAVAPPEIPSIQIQVAESDRAARGGDLTNAPFVVTDASESSLAQRGSRQRSSRPLYIILTVTLVGLMAVGIVAFLLNGQEPVTETHAPTPVAEPAEAVEKTAPVAVNSSAAESAAIETPPPNVNLVDDDGKTLWASPTAGQPLVLDFLPSGAQLIFVLRPTALLNSPEGPKLLAALGPAGVTLQTQLQATLGVPLVEIEQLTVGFIPDDTLAPRAAYVMRLGGEVPRATLLAAWGNPSPATHAGRDYFARDGMGYYFPLAEADRVVAIAPEAMLQQVLELKGKPLLRRGIEQLLSHSDDQRQFTLLLTPSYLLTDGRDLLAGPLAALHAPLRQFLDESIEAVLLSAQVDAQLFVELRVAAPVDRPPLALQELLRSRWEKIPERVENYVAALDPQEHGQLMIQRFPRMLELARDYTRSGVDDRQVVMSTVLPAAAAHNLILGADLTLLETAGSDAATEPAAASPSVRTAAESLKQKITLRFPRESLEAALELISQEIDVPIVIVGADLQLDGITRNQAINNFDQRDQPAEQALRKLLLLANPEGKLVYQISPAGGGRETVRITTRAALKKRGEPLPPGF
jgi:serine/threonine protein kinase